MAEPFIQIDNLVKSYTRDTQTLTVLTGLNLSVDEGEFIALMGPSGSGKTTLLNLVAASTGRPPGRSWWAGQRRRMSEGQLAKWRSGNVGFIFQLYNLVPVLTAFENVELPLLLTKLSRARRRKQVELALSIVRPLGPDGPLPAAALGRAGAARRHRARQSRPTEAPRGRRADRRPRRTERRRRS